jgi:hypothetical protein
MPRDLHCLDDDSQSDENELEKGTNNILVSRVIAVYTYLDIGYLPLVMVYSLMDLL